MEERKCPVCHKTFIVPSKSKWAYRKMSQLICSWTCLRALEMKKGEDKGMRSKVPEEAKQEAIRVAIAGGNPIEILEPYTNNPKAMWWAIKAKVKETDPETYAKLPDLRNTRKPANEEKPVTAADAMAACQDAADKFFGQCQDMGLKVEKPEAEPMKITQPIRFSGMTVRAVEGDFGSYHFQEINGKQWIDYDDKEMANQLSMTVEQWKGFLKEIYHAAQILGVTL